MALILKVRSGTASAPSLTLDLPKVLLGRSPSCDLVLPDPSVSHQHASIRQRGSEYIVLDEGSTNGTHVGPVRLSGGTPRVLGSGDLLRLGRVWVEVRIEQAVPTPSPKDLTKEIALRLVEGALSAEGEESVCPRVQVQGGSDAGKALALERFNSPYVIGRGKRCHLILEDEDCSRRHVELLRRGGRIWVRELGSKNGARLGETPLSEEAVAWTPGTPLALGQCTLELDDPASSTLWELERAADEAVDDSVDPPSAAEAPEPKEPRAPPEAGRRPAKVARVPNKSHVAEEPSRGRTWGLVDFAILLLALLVLTVSVVGLWWLL